LRDAAPTNIGHAHTHTHATPQQHTKASTSGVSSQCDLGYMLVMMRVITGPD
jgi:hypothetical protein